MLVARIAVIFVLIYFISRLFYTPTFADIVRRFRGARKPKPINFSSRQHTRTLQG
jgi:hypothetical protein